MFEKEAEEYGLENYRNYDDYPYVLTDEKAITKAFKDGAEFGYKKANEWHYVKDGDLPKETKKYFIYSKEWGVELRKFFADVGYFECRKNDVIAWKEIVLPNIKEDKK